VEAGKITPAAEAVDADPEIVAMGRRSLSLWPQPALGGQKHMTRTDLEINQEGMWRALVFEQQTTLTLAVEMLLRCHLSPEQILTKTAMALEGSHHDS
jgi:hypothetical protein